MKPLDERFGSMLKPGARATDIGTMIGEVEQQIARLKNEAETAHSRSLDPLISEADAANARAEAQGYEFAIERWTSRLGLLQARFVERTESDQSAARTREFNETRDESAKLADDIRTRAPALFAELVDLLSRIEANDKRVADANRLKPGGEAPILFAEAQARDFLAHGVWKNGVDYVERLTNIKLPKFNTWGRMWPIDPGVTAAMQMAETAARVRMAHREREATRAWFTVQRTDTKTGQVSLQHADGFFRLGRQEWLCELYGDQVRKAEAAGMIVKAAKAPADQAA